MCSPRGRARARGRSRASRPASRVTDDGSGTFRLYTPKGVAAPAKGGRYQERVDVEFAAVHDQRFRTDETANTLPAEALKANGVSATAIRRLSDRAANLTGSETAEIAQSIAGDGVGRAAHPDAADDRSGAPDNRTGAGPDRTDDAAPSSSDGRPADGDSSAGTNETTTVAGQD